MIDDFLVPFIYLFIFCVVSIVFSQFKKKVSYGLNVHMDIIYFFLFDLPVLVLFRKLNQFIKMIGS